MSIEVRLLLTNYYNLIYSIIENTDVKGKEKDLLLKDYNLLYKLLKED